MISDLKLSKIFWCVPSILSIFAAMGGIIFRDIYVNLFPKDFLPGALPQDILTLIVGVFLLVLIFTTRQNDYKKQVIIIGLIGSLFYLYGIFTIERVYNWYYIVYAAIFSSSFWSIVYSISGFRNKNFTGLQISNVIRNTTAISSIIIAVLFTFLWITALIPLMREHNRIEYLYSIYILDLCFIMPAFFITAIMSFLKKPLGILIGPAIMILGFFVIFPLGLNELAKLSLGMVVNYGAMIISFAFALYMLSIASLQLKMCQYID